MIYLKTSQLSTYTKLYKRHPTNSSSPLCEYDMYSTSRQFVYSAADYFFQRNQHKPQREKEIVMLPRETSKISTNAFICNQRSVQDSR